MAIYQILKIIEFAQNVGKVKYGNSSVSLKIILKNVASPEGAWEFSTHASSMNMNELVLIEPAFAAVPRAC